MNERLVDVLEGREENYLLPFYWKHQGNRARIPDEIRAIRASGCRAFCVESRPFDDFCGPEWWSDMQLILEEAKRQEMKVWILDDKHFPTGYANGIAMKTYPEARRWFLREHHLDVMGPMRAASFLVPPCEGEEIRLAVCAYRRAEPTGNVSTAQTAFLREGQLTGRESGHPDEVFSEALIGDPIVFDLRQDARMLHWDVPEGCWRLFFVFQTRRGGSGGLQDAYVNFLSASSAHGLIEAVYETHWAHFSNYFGNTLAGFFSDEPSFDANHIGPWGQDPGFYDRTVGQPGVALPWDPAVAVRLGAACSVSASLPLLWYPLAGKHPDARLAYMDAVTDLWRTCFSRQVGDWCREHGVQYIGHVIEDMNAHARLGCSGGHYFRSLDGQDMSGLDIVLHQVMPGMGQYPNAASIAGGVADPAFFHYVLGHLGSSLARLHPRMKGRAMCEVFGAYGWAEGVPCMKWLMDFLLVRGINRFVPHAFSDLYPDPDCPPHFHAQGNDPQMEAFSVLMRYVNRMAHLLEGADRETPGAILYHAEAEWMGGEARTLVEVPAKALYDAHIDYDIVPLDALAEAEIRDRCLWLNGHPHRFLVVPAARRWPAAVAMWAERLAAAGVPVFWTGSDTRDTYDAPVPSMRVISADRLSEVLLAEGLAHAYFPTEVPTPLLRIARFDLSDTVLFLLFQEGVTEPVETVVQLPVEGDSLVLDLLYGAHRRGHAPAGRLAVTLQPYQSMLVAFGQGADFTANLSAVPEEEEKRSAAPGGIRTKRLEVEWDVALLETGVSNTFEPFGSIRELFSLTGPNGQEGFSGIMRYRTRWNGGSNRASRVVLDLGQVGQTAEVKLDGRSLGQRICPPYRWEIDPSRLATSDHDLEILVANTLVHRLPDAFSRYMAIPGSGLLGPVTVQWEESEGDVHGTL